MNFFPAAAEARRRSPRLSPRTLDAAASGMAIILLVTVSAGLVFEQSANTGEDAVRAARPAGASTSLAGSETMIGAYGGAPYTYPSDVVVKKPGAHDFTVRQVPWDGDPFKSPIYYGARVAHWFAGNKLGTMLDFTHSKTIARLKDEVEFSGKLDGKDLPARAKLSDVFQKLEFSHGHNMLTLNGLVRLGSLTPRLSPYAGLGLGVSLPHSEVGFAASKKRTYEYQYAGPVAQAVFGMEFRLPRTSVFIEYKFSIARYHVPLSQIDGTLLPLDLWGQFSNWISGNAPPDGDLLTILASHQVTAGLGVRFSVQPAAVP